MEYETYGWKHGSSIAYFDGDEYTLEHDGWWWNYDSELDMLGAMSEIAPLSQWRFCNVSDLRRNDEKA